MFIQEAQILRKQRRFTEALALLDQCANQGDPRLIEERFNVAFDQRDPSKTIELGRLLMQALPERAIEILSRCGLLLRETADPGGAVQLLMDALARAGGDHGKLPDWFFATLYGANSDLKDWDAALVAALSGAPKKPLLFVWASFAQRTLRRYDEAAINLHKAIVLLADQPHHAQAVVSACRALNSDKPCSATESLLAKAELAFGESSVLTLEMANEAAKACDWSLLAIIATKIATTRSNLVVPALRMLVQAARGDLSLHELSTSVFEQAIRRHPINQEIVFIALEFLSVKMNREEAIAHLFDFQRQESHLLPALTVELARWGRMANVFEACREHVKLVQRTSAFRAFSRLVSGLVAFEPLPQDALAEVLKQHPSEIRLFLLLRQPETRVIRIRSPKDGDRPTMDSAGIEAAPLIRLLEDLTTLQPEYAAFLSSANISSAKVRERIRRDESYCAFQDRVVRDRRFDMVDPLTGTKVEVFDSVKIFDRQVFSFRGKELFLFISGGNMNAGIFIFLVSSNLLLQIDTPTSACTQTYYGSEIHMAELMAVYFIRAFKAESSFLASAARASASGGLERTIVAIHGRAENPAHHIWNYLSAFERIQLFGGLRNVSTVVRPPTEYFGDVREIFPELSATEIISLPSEAIIDPCPFSPEHIAIWLGGNFIPRTLQRRIQRWAYNNVPSGKLEVIEATIESHGPLIWIGLRSGDKVWVNQTKGIVEVIDDLVQDFPKALFLLDGFSLPGAQTSVPAKWASAVEEIRMVAENICSSVSSPECVLSLVGNTIAESVVWAANVDVYFTPMGSSQHKVGWYGSATGIIYTSAKIEGTPVEMRPGVWEVEGSPIPDFVIGNIANGGRRRDNFDFRSNIENIDIDAASVIEKIRSGLRKSTGFPGDPPPAE